MDILTSFSRHECCFLYWRFSVLLNATTSLDCPIYFQKLSIYFSFLQCLPMSFCGEISVYNNNHVFPNACVLHAAYDFSPRGISLSNYQCQCSLMCIEDQKQSHEEGNDLLAKMKADCILVISLSCQVTLFAPFRLTCLLFEP